MKSQSSKQEALKRLAYIEGHINYTFPAPGNYALYDELDLPGHNNEVHRFDLEVGGSRIARLVADMAPKKSEDYMFDLQPVGEVKAGQSNGFIGLISGGGNDSRHLQMLVGQPAHVAVLDQDTGSFTHIVNRCMI